MPTPNESGGGRSLLDRFAALIAPAIDRVFVGAMRYAGSRAGHLRDRYGSLPYGFLIDFRFVLPLRDVTPEPVAALSRYQRRDPYQGIRELAGAGMVEIAADRRVRRADRGHAFLDDLFQLHSDAVEQLWRRQMAALPQLALLIGIFRGNPRLQAGEESGCLRSRIWVGGSPSGGPPYVQMCEVLSVLRYGVRCGAGREAGLQVPFLPDG